MTIPDDSKMNPGLFPLKDEDNRQFMSHLIASKGMITDRVKQVSRQIMTDYAGKEITVLVIMRGALEFYEELAEHGLKTNSSVKVTVMK